MFEQKKKRQTFFVRNILGITEIQGLFIKKIFKNVLIFSLKKYETILASNKSFHSLSFPFSH